MYRSLMVGAACGLRAFSGPSLLAARAHVGGRYGAPAILLLGAGELVGDKLPATPPRTDPPGLAARVATGGLCGYRFDGVLGVAVAAVAAVGAAYGGREARARIVKATKLPDPVVAVAEDALALSLAALAVR
jgi:uncharacterized membrane protein